MPVVRAMVVVPADNQLPSDSVVNNWGFFTQNTDLATLTAIRDALVAFYNPLNTYLSSLYVWNQTRVKFYNLGDAPPRVPLADLAMTLTEAGAGTNLPQEVALCASFRGALESGANMARRRGRIYLGPWSVGAGNGTTARPQDALITLVRDRMAALHTASTVATDWKWAVISGFGEPLTAHNVVAGWVDNAWDTQRRRGNEATSRVTFTG